MSCVETPPAACSRPPRAAADRALPRPAAARRPTTPVVSLMEGSTPLIARAAAVGAARRRDAPQVRGHEPDRQLQGPRHDRRRLVGEGQGRRGDHLRLDRQHGRERRRLRRARRHARRGDRARGQDRARQARPGGDARRARDRAARQLRPGAGAREARSSTRQPGRAGQLDQPVPDRGPEDGRVRGLRRARRGARRARDPGRQRRQRHRLVEGVRRVRAGPAAAATASRPRAPRRSCSASRSRSPETVASAIRIGNPARWKEAEEALDAVGRHDRGRQRRRDPRRRSAGSPRTRGCSASPLRRRASPACSKYAARGRRCSCAC